MHHPSTTLPFVLTLLSFLITTSSSQQIQTTAPPSLSDYTTALLLDFLRRGANNPPTSSIGSTDALFYCEENVAACTNQLTLFSNCQSQYGTAADKYLWCLCTTSYHSAVSECDACSASLGAIPWSYVSGDVDWAQTECAGWYSTFGTPSAGDMTTTATTKKGGGGGTGSKTGAGSGASGTTATATQGSSPSDALPSSTSIAVTLPTGPYAGLAGSPTIPAGSGSAPTSSGGAAGAPGRSFDSMEGGIFVAGLVLGLGVIL